MNGGVVTSMSRWGSYAARGGAIAFVITRDERRPNAPIDFALPGHTTRVTFDGALDNRMHVYRRCAESIRSPDEHIVANDLLELGMVAALRLANPVAFFLHGDYDYYYDLACAHSARIGTFACVSRRVGEVLTARLPHRRGDIRVVYPIVPEPAHIRIPEAPEAPIRLLFVGRPTVEKGFDTLPAVAKELEKRGISAVWTVVAPRYGPSIAAGENWLRSPNVTRYEAVPPDAMNAIYSSHDVLIAPSRLEGFGMAILEALKSGVVPVASGIKAGVPELIEDGVTGFVVGESDPAGMADRVALLSRDRGRLREMGVAGRERANSRFASAQCAEAMTDAILAASPRSVPPGEEPTYLSRLDRSWLPNPIVRIARRAFLQVPAGSGLSSDVAR